LDDAVWVSGDGLRFPAGLPGCAAAPVCRRFVFDLRYDNWKLVFKEQRCVITKLQEAAKSE